MTTEHNHSATPGTKGNAAKGTTARNETMIVDMGKADKKAIRKLRKGKSGKLTRRLEETVQHLQTTGELDAGSRVVVVVIRERRRSRGRGPLGLP